MTEKFRYVDTLIKPHNKPIVNDEEIYTKGKFTLREYEDVNYCESEFYFDDECLDNKEVIDLLNDLYEENKQYKILTDELKRQNKKLKGRLNDLGVEYY